MKVRGHERSSDWATLKESSLSGSESGSQSVSVFKAVGQLTPQLKVYSQSISTTIAIPIPIRIPMISRSATPRARALQRPGNAQRILAVGIGIGVAICIGIRGRRATDAAIEGLFPVDFDNGSDPDSDTDPDDLPQRHPEEAGQFSPL